MKSYLEIQLQQALGKSGVSTEALDIQFEKPKQPEHGDIATNVALVLAKREKRNPRQLAENIKGHLELDPDMVSEVEVAGPGFLNFRYSPVYVRTQLRQVLSAGGDFGKSGTGRQRKINVEWVSANPTGPLHAGHGRQVCIGATLCTLLEWNGWTVTREYYYNNAGNQMQNLALSVRERYRELAGRQSREENIHYAGDYIREVAAAILENHGASVPDENLDLFRTEAESYCFSSIKRTLEGLEVHHDVFYNEDSLYSEGKIDTVLGELREKGLAYDLDGAVWLKTTAFGTDKDRVIVKSSGEPTYRLPDIAYHKEKILAGYDRIVDIFGADHIATIPDVLAGVKALGFKTEHIDVIIHQMVSFVNEGDAVKMSKRSGNVYFLDDLIEDVGSDAVRYFFIMRSANSHLDFDIRLAREQSENNPVYYLQYAHARIASIVRFAENEGMDSRPDKARLELLEHPAEYSLIKSLAEFPEVIEYCGKTYELQNLCTYLHGVATAFHKFYHECRVVTENRNLSSARILLCRAAKQVIENGLTVLGISAPERM